MGHTLAPFACCLTWEVTSSTMGCSGTGLIKSGVDAPDFCVLPIRLGLLESHIQSSHSPSDLEVLNHRISRAGRNPKGSLSPGLLPGLVRGMLICIVILEQTSFSLFYNFYAICQKEKWEHLASSQHWSGEWVTRTQMGKSRGKGRMGGK